MQRRTFVQAPLCLAALHATAYAAEAYPSKPIKVTAPFAPGSSDLIVRKLGEYVGKDLKQVIVVENKPGAQGTTASKAAAAAKPDGYALLLGTNSTHAASPYLFKHLGYDPVKDFTPIVQFTINPLLLVVSAALPVSNLAEFIDFAKKSPKPLNFGAGNTGSLVAAEMLRRRGGFEATAINYQGNSQAVQDFIAGRLDFMVTDSMIVKPFEKSGKFKVLGVTSKERLPSFPAAVPLAEQGLEGFDYASWVGLFGPAGMAPEVADQLHATFTKALQMPDVQQFLQGIGMLPVHKSRPDFQRFVGEQIAAWGRLSKDAGLVAT